MESKVSRQSLVLTVGVLYAWLDAVNCLFRHLNVNQIPFLKRLFLPSRKEVVVHVHRVSIMCAPYLVDVGYLELRVV